MKKYLATAAIAALLAQPSIAMAATCTSGSYSSAYWLINPMVTSVALNKTATASQNWYNYDTKISLLISTYKAADGASGCLGTSIIQKGLPAAPLGYSALAPAALDASPNFGCAMTEVSGPKLAGMGGATLVENLRSSSNVPTTYTHIARIPVGKVQGAEKTTASYDVKIVLTPGKVVSTCYAPVDGSGVSEFWNGR